MKRETFRSQSYIHIIPVIPPIQTPEPCAIPPPLDLNGRGTLRVSQISDLVRLKIVFQVYAAHFWVLNFFPSVCGRFLGFLASTLGGGDVDQTQPTVHHKVGAIHLPNDLGMGLFFPPVHEVFL